MLYREIIAVCSQIHTKHINTVCGQSVELLNVKPAVHILTTGIYKGFNNTFNMKHIDIQITVPLFSVSVMQNKLKGTPAKYLHLRMQSFHYFFPRLKS